MKKMSTEAMRKANGGWKGYRVYDHNCGMYIYVKNKSEWNAHGRRKKHYWFNSMHQADWSNRSRFYC